ncbi:restriction endonuclease subunit S [Streptomyces sp. NPDC057253]|uniref:restriction endonuclease subunit S n=1 Tax=Streptomyces sp. NPDC057253 TaxID=3346069 RepID=UPI003626D42D
MTNTAATPWATCRVKFLATKIGSGKTPSGGAETYQEQGILFLRSQNIHFDGLRLDDVAYIDTRVHREMRSTRVMPGDVLLNITGASLGRVSRFRTGLGDANVNQHVCIIRPSQSIESRYLNYTLLAQPTQEKILALQVGGNRDGLNFEQVGNLEIPLPDIEDQHRIADFLDTETARIDRMVRAREAQIACLEERCFAAVTEALIPAALERPLGTFPHPWLPELTVDAPMTRLGYVCRLQNGITVDENRAPTANDVTRPYLRVANVQAGHVALDSVTEITVPRHMARRSTLRIGDVLMTEGGDLDKLGRGTVWRGELADCLHQNHVFALRPDPQKLDSDYLALMTQTLHGRCYFESTGTKTTNLASTNSSKILSFAIPLPSIERQRELVQDVHAQQAANQRMKRSLTRQVALLAERRQALITAAVTGQLDVTTARGVDAA